MQVPARELQFSSLGFSPLQPVKSSPQPIASTLGVFPFLGFPRVPVDAGYLLGCFNDRPPNRETQFLDGGVVSQHGLAHALFSYMRYDDRA